MEIKWEDQRKAELKECLEDYKDALARYRWAHSENEYEAEAADCQHGLGYDSDDEETPYRELKIAYLKSRLLFKSHDEVWDILEATEKELKELNQKFGKTSEEWYHIDELKDKLEVVRYVEDLMPW